LTLPGAIAYPPRHSEKRSDFMNTGAKIAIGCGLAVVGLGVVGVVGMVATGYWVKQKVGGTLEKIQSDQKQIDTYLQQAKAHSFTAPSDGVITEAQLQKFLGVRKRVYPVYERYGKELEAMGKDKSKAPGIQGFGTVMSAINELRLAQAKALAEEGVSPAEYGYLVGAVYTTYYAAAFQKSTGKTFSEAAA
jgi:hypothetical protein